MKSIHKKSVWESKEWSIWTSTVVRNRIHLSKHDKKHQSQSMMSEELLWFRLNYWSLWCCWSFEMNSASDSETASLNSASDSETKKLEKWAAVAVQNDESSDSSKQSIWFHCMQRIKLWRWLINCWIDSYEEAALNHIFLLHTQLHCWLHQVICYLQFQHILWLCLMCINTFIRTSNESRLRVNWESVLIFIWFHHLLKKKGARTSWVDHKISKTATDNEYQVRMLQLEEQSLLYREKLLSQIILQYVWLSIN